MIHPVTHSKGCWIALQENLAEPNTALLSAILMFGTFFIAYFLRIFRNGQGHNSTSFFDHLQITT